jgi:hypothetical protein
MVGENQFLKNNIAGFMTLQLRRHWYQVQTFAIISIFGPLERKKIIKIWILKDFCLTTFPDEHIAVFVKKHQFCQLQPAPKN